MEITKENIEDSAKFSNFAQRVKLAYWDWCLANSPNMKKENIDQLLLLSWEDFKKYAPKESPKKTKIKRIHSELRDSFERRSIKL